MTTAFQRDAFQLDAFQAGANPPSGSAPFVPVDTGNPVLPKSQRGGIDVSVSLLCGVLAASGGGGPYDSVQFQPDAFQIGVYGPTAGGAAAAPFVPYDCVDLSQFRKVSPQQQQITPNLLASRLAPPPFSIELNDLPYLAARQTRLDTTQNLLTSTLAVTAAPLPFAQDDWPLFLPAKKALQPEVIPNITVNLPDGTAFRLPAFYNRIEVKLFSVDNPPNLLTGTLGSTAVVVLPFAQYDWPNPLVLPKLKIDVIPNKLVSGIPWIPPVFATDIQNPIRRVTVTYDITPNLLASNLAPPPFKAVETTAQSSIKQVRQDVTENLLTSTLSSAVVVLPFQQNDWPNPQIRQRQTTFELTRNENVSGLPAPVLIPFNQGDQPNPVGKVGIRFDVFPNLLASNLSPPPFTPADLPLASAVKRSYQDAVPNLLENTLKVTAVTVLPFAQYDWPNPIILPKLKIDVIPNQLVIGIPAQVLVKPFAAVNWDNVIVPRKLIVDVIPNNLVRGIPWIPPVFATDLQIQIKRVSVSFDVTPNLLASNLAPPPLRPTDIPAAPLAVRQARQDITPNLLASNLAPKPFIAYDSSPIRFVSPVVRLDVVENLLASTLAVVTAPFKPINVPVTLAIRYAKQDIFPNVLLNKLAPPVPIEDVPREPYYIRHLPILQKPYFDSPNVLLSNLIPQNVFKDGVLDVWNARFHSITWTAKLDTTTWDTKRRETTWRVKRRRK